VAVAWVLEMNSPKLAPAVENEVKTELAELVQSRDLAKWTADADLDSVEAVAAKRVPRGYILVGLVVIGWAVVIGMVLAFRAIIGL
jgi:hypothetical protein